MAVRTFGLRTNRCSVYTLCDSSLHYRKLFTHQHLQYQRIIISWYHLWMNINRYYRICSVQAIVVYHSLAVKLLVLLQIESIRTTITWTAVYYQVEGKIGLGVQKKVRVLFFREGVTASALNDRQISITTYKMIDRRYTSARFKDTSEKQPRRWVKIVTRPFFHIGRKLIIIIPLPVRAVDNNSDRTFVIHYTKPDSTFGEHEIRRFTQL